MGAPIRSRRVRLSVGQEPQLELAVAVDEPDRAGHPVPTPLVVVNGAFCSLRMWDGVVGVLAANRTVIRHDVRGTGRSDSGPSDQNRFEVYADDIASLCRQLGVERAVVWGMAWGARLALVTAARHPDLVERLVLTDLGIDPADPVAQRDGYVAARRARAAVGIAEVERPEGWRQHDDEAAATASLAATLLHPDLGPFVEQVSCPTLIATGDHDPNLRSSRRALDLLGDGMLVELEHTGHGSVLNRPDQVLAAVVPFIADARGLA
jgi:pimeloyl-ACP methyl ester carboxylesterase